MEIDIECSINSETAISLWQRVRKSDLCVWMPAEPPALFNAVCEIKSFQLSEAHDCPESWADAALLWVDLHAAGMTSSHVGSSY